MEREKLLELGKRITEEVWNKGDTSAIDKYFADDMKLVTRGATFSGKEGYKQFQGMYREGFPDLKIETHDYFTDGDSTALEWTFTGTHSGPFLGIEPSGNQVNVSGVTITKFENGKVVEQRLYFDRIEQLEAVGLQPGDLAKIQPR